MDDAAVYRLTSDLAVVQTVDFITPIVDDPYRFGRIAAANALSDIYAMGAKPLFALNLVGFPVKTLPMGVLGEILKGAAHKAAEAGIQILGGHSIEDFEPKFGLSVTGVVHPARVVRNSTARPGDRLILTKPLGLGVLTTAGDRAGPEALERAVATMETLNSAASGVMTEVGVTACTDVTGFGLLGHLYEMVTASGVGAVVTAISVPILPEAEKLASEGVAPAGSHNNLAYLEDRVAWGRAATKTRKILLSDAQTSGGLLIAVPAAKSRKLLKRLHEAGVTEAVEIGGIVTDESAMIRVV